MRIFKILMIVTWFFGVIYSQSEWDIIQSPQIPQLSSRDNIFFITPDEGWIVGSAGSTTPNLILHTTDAGATWEVQHSMPNAQDTSWSTVFFLKNGTGWLAGKNGIIWKSEDFGYSWIDQTPGLTTKEINAIYVVDTNVVYMVADADVILKTEDGGKTWNLQNSGNSSDNWEDIYAFDTDHAFAVSSKNAKIIWTNDGGQTWNTIQLQIPPGAQISKLYLCTGDTSGVAYVGGYHGMLFKTDDFGQTWESVALLYPGQYVRPYCLSILDTNNIWYGFPNGQVFHSSDGGTTWDTLDIPTGEDIKEVQVFNNDTLYIFGKYGQFFKSFDSGQSFIPMLQWPSVLFWSMTTAGDKKVFAASYLGGDLAISEDGGQTWSYPKHYTKAISNIYNLFFINDTVGFYCGFDGMIGKTMDGGHTWELIDNLYSGDKDFYFIYFKDQLHGFVGGQSGKLLATSDGGETWSEISSGLTNSLYDCVFLDNNIGIIVGSDGTITRTIDGGASWTEVMNETGITENIRSIAFKDNTTGFAVTLGGYILKTTDSGTSWSLLTQLSNNNNPTDNPDLFKIIFVNENRGYICGEDGAIYKTIDGGVTWNQLEVPDEIKNNDLKSMTFLNETIGFVSGQNGYILATGLTDINPAPSIVRNYSLNQNYPNPFNPQTTIGFQIAKTENVKLIIYNALGQIVRILVDGRLPAGYHSVVWDGRNQYGLSSPSGIYFYRLEAGNFQQVNKMILIR